MESKILLDFFETFTIIVPSTIQVNKGDNPILIEIPVEIPIAIKVAA